MRVEPFQLSPKGTFVCIEDEGIYSTESGELVLKTDGCCIPSFSKDESFVVATDEDDVIGVFSTTDFALVRDLKFDLGFAVISPSDEIFACGRREGCAACDIFYAPSLTDELETIATDVSGGVLHYRHDRIVIADCEYKHNGELLRTLAFDCDTVFPIGDDLFSDGCAIVSGAPVLLGVIEGDPDKDATFLFFMAQAERSVVEEAVELVYGDRRRITDEGLEYPLNNGKSFVVPW